MSTKYFWAKLPKLSVFPYLFFAVQQKPTHATTPIVPIYHEVYALWK